MKKEIIEICCNELINEINNVNKQIDEINLKIAENDNELVEARVKVSTFIKCESSLLAERESLNKRIDILNCMVKMLEGEVEEE